VHRDLKPGNGILPEPFGLGYPNMDITSDGRFVAIRKTAATIPGVTMIENWFTEFRARNDQAEKP
jgi:hypothetical protein